jgi:hypothetical protein
MARRCWTTKALFSLLVLAACQPYPMNQTPYYPAYPRYGAYPLQPNQQTYPTYPRYGTYPGQPNSQTFVHRDNCPHPAICTSCRNQQEQDRSDYMDCQLNRHGPMDEAAREQDTEAAKAFLIPLLKGIAEAKKKCEELGDDGGIQCYELLHLPPNSH